MASNESETTKNENASEVKCENEGCARAYILVGANVLGKGRWLEMVCECVQLFPYAVHIHAIFTHTVHHDAVHYIAC